MGTLAQNLASFVSCNLQINLSTCELSKLGYHYISTTGLIECSSCAYKLTNYSDSTIGEISKEHAKWSPKCKLLDSNKSKDNTALESCVEFLEKFKDQKGKKNLTGYVEVDNIVNGRNNGPNHKAQNGTNDIAGEDQVDNAISRQHLQNFKEQTGKGNLCGEDRVDSGFCSEKCPSKSSDTLSTIRNSFPEVKPSLKNAAHSTKISGKGETTPLENLLTTIVVLTNTRKDETDIENINDTGYPSASVLNGAASVKPHEIDAAYLMKFSKHPIMSCTEERRESFKGQEQKYKHCERANIEDFVAAGLFYVGPEDNVRCFFCDGGLRNVQSHNHPFLEHKRWFPNCKFLIYLEEHKKNQTAASPNSGKKRLDRDDVDGALAFTDFSFKIPGRALEAREVKARLETSVVQELMKQGFQREYLKRAVERRFILCGDDYSSAHELIKDILDVEGDKALPRPGQNNNNNQGNNSAAQNRDAVDGAAAAAVVRTAVSCTGQKLLGKGKDLLAAEAEFPVSEEVRNMKTADVLQTLKNTQILDQELKGLWDVYQEQSQVRTCKICLDREINTVFLPCGHYVTCDKCCPKISHCCICRALIRGTVLALSATCEIK